VTSARQAASAKRVGERGCTTIDIARNLRSFGAWSTSPTNRWRSAHRRGLIETNQEGSHQTTMKMIDRYRNRREVARRNRAIERALRATDSPAVRDEIRIMAQRYYG
jgi:hypothetical protein